MKTKQKGRWRILALLTAVAMTAGLFAVLPELAAPMEVNALSLSGTISTPGIYTGTYNGSVIIAQGGDYYFQNVTINANDFVALNVAAENVNVYLSGTNNISATANAYQGGGSAAVVAINGNIASTVTIADGVTKVVARNTNRDHVYKYVTAVAGVSLEVNQNAILDCESIHDTQSTDGLYCFCNINSLVNNGTIRALLNGAAENYESDFFLNNRGIAINFTNNGSIYVKHINYGTCGINTFRTHHPSNIINNGVIATDAGDNQITDNTLSISGSGTRVSLSQVSAPSAVLGSTRVTGRGKLNVSWGVPANNGGMGIARYILKRGNTQIYAGPATSYEDTGLADATGYTYTIQAENAVGVGAAATVQGTTASVPKLSGTFSAAPNGTGISGGNQTNNTVTLNWGAASTDAAVPVTAYKIYRDGTTEGNVVATVSSGSSEFTNQSWTDTGLNAGQTYTYYLKAVNAVGESGISAGKTAVAVGTPGVPGNLKAETEKKVKNVKLSWSASAENGGGAVTYEIYRSGSSSAIATTKELTYTDSTVADGTYYTYQVLARNGGGPSEKSAAAEVTAESTANPPKNVKVGKTSASGAGKLVVSWELPETKATANTQITGYRVYEVIGGVDTYIGQTADGLTYSLTVPVDTGRYEPGSSHSFKVSTVNEVGESAKSGAVGAAAHQLPGTPAGAGASAQSQDIIRVSWSALSAATNEELDILQDQYRVRVYTNSNLSTEVTGAQVSRIEDGANNSKYVDVSGLSKGTAYYFTIEAKNELGYSPAAARAQAVTHQEPGNPVNVKTVSDDANKQVIVTWKDGNDGGAAVDGYKIEIYSDSEGTDVLKSLENIQVSETADRQNQTVIKPEDLGLEMGKEYWLSIYAHNSVGYGVRSAPSLMGVTGPPSAVSSLKAAAESDTVIRVNWNFANNNGVNITKYVVRYRKAGDTNYGMKDVEVADQMVEKYETRLENLSADTEYEFEVYAVNANGNSGGKVQTTARTLRTPKTVPNIGAEATKKSGELQVSWTGMSENPADSNYGGGSEILGYRVYYRVSETQLSGSEELAKKTDAGLGTPGGWNCANPADGEDDRLIAAGAYKYTVSGLQDGVTYDLAVAAVNQVGESDLSDSGLTAASGYPMRPADMAEGLRYEILSGTDVRLSWKEPPAYLENQYGTRPEKLSDCFGVGYEGGSGGELPFAVSEVNLDAQSGEYSVTVTAAELGSSWNLSVYAVTEAGKGTECYTGEIQLWKKPYRPLELKAEPTNASRELSLSWEEPLDNGDNTESVRNPILGYRAYYREAGQESWSCANPAGAGDVKSNLITERHYILDGKQEGVQIENGKAYEIRVSAVNGAGEGEGSESVTATPRRAPDAPEIGTVRTGNNAVTFSTINIPDNGGSAVKSYTVYGRKTARLWYDLEADEAKREEITGEEYVQVEVYKEQSDFLSDHAVTVYFENGYEYEVYVKAENDAGVSGESNHGTVKVGMPETPGSYRVEATRNQQIKATYEASRSNGSEILGYKVYTHTSADPDNVKVETIHDLTYIYQGVDNGDDVWISVSAYNTIGESEPTKDWQVFVGSPTVPRVTSTVLYTTDAAAETSGVTLRWSESQTNGNKLQEYTIYLYTEGSALPEAFRIPNPGDAFELREYNIPQNESGTRFEVGKSYTLTVTARNGAGESPESDGEMIRFGVPQAPVVMGLENGANTLEVRWSRPVDNGSPILSYNIYTAGNLAMKYSWESKGENLWQVYTENILKGGERTDLEERSSDPGQDTEYRMTIPDLANGVEYSVQVSAVNGNGEGAKSVVESKTPIDQPMPPRSLEGTAVFAPESGDETGRNQHKINLSWKAPYYNGGAVIDRYEIHGYEVDADGGNPVELDSSKIKHSGNATTAEAVNLEKGKYYTFKVRAHNEKDYSEYIELEAPVRTLYDPDPPTITQLIGGASNATIQPVTVKWNAPADNGGSDVTGYDIFINGYCMNIDENGHVVHINPSLNSYKVKSNRLKTTNLLPYTVCMKAYNAVGESSYSDTMSIQLGTPPAVNNVTVSDIEVTSTGSGATVHWSTDDFEPDTIVTRYNVYFEDPEANKTALPVGSLSGDEIGSNTVEITMIDSKYIGREIPVYVVAQNNKGEGQKSEPVYITLGAPSEVRNADVKPGFESLEISWEEPEKFNSANRFENGKLEPYSYVIYLDGERAASVAYNDSTATTDQKRYSVVLDQTRMENGRRLEGGKEYTVTIKVECVIDFETVLSQPNAGVKATPWSLPTAPRISENTVRTETESFRFGYEEADGKGLEIGRYEVYLDFDITDEAERGFVNPLPGAADENNPNQPWAEIDRETRSVAIHNITPGRREDKPYGHTYSLVTVTNPGSGTESELRSLMPEGNDIDTVTTGIPGVPVIREATPAGSSISLSWDAVERIDLSKNTDYYAYTLDGGTTQTTVKSTSCTIPGLDSKNEVTIRLKAVNAVGESEWSAPPVTVRPGAPTAPQLEKAVGGDGKINLTWVASTANTSSISKYYVYIEGQAQYIQETTNTVSTNNRITTSIPELENGKEYVFYVVAENQLGYQSTQSNRLSARPGKVPGRIAEEQITAEALGDMTVKLSWKTPEDTGGLEIEKYIVSWEGNVLETNGETSALIGGLTPGRTYTFEVRAKNAIGEGPAVISPGVTTWTVPGKPKWKSIKSADNKITANWKAPDSSGGSEILGYNVYVGESEIPVNQNLIPVGEDVISYTIEGERVAVGEPGEEKYESKPLSTGKEYSVRIKAVNTVGESESSDSLTIEVIGPVSLTEPGAPTGVEAVAGNGMLKVSWLPPAYDGYTDIDFYRIYAGPDADNLTQVGEVKAPTNSCNVSGLTNGVTYCIAVKAHNRIGFSEFSEPIYQSPKNIKAPSKPEWPVFDMGHQTYDFSGEKPVLVPDAETDREAVSAYISNASGTRIDVNWLPSVGEAEAGTVTYQVFIDGEYAADVPQSAKPSYSISAEPGQAYNIQILATNDAGSAASTYIRAYSDLNVKKDLINNYEYDRQYGKDGRYESSVLANIDRNYDGNEDDVITETVPKSPEQFGMDRSGKTVTLKWRRPNLEDNENIDYGQIDYYSVYVNREEVQRLYVNTAADEYGRYQPSYDADNPLAVKDPSIYCMDSDILETGVSAYLTKLNISYDKPYTITMASHSEYGESAKTGGLLVYVSVTKEPSNLSGSLVDDGTYGKVDLTWNAPEDPEAVSGYKIYVGTDEKIIHAADENHPDGYTIPADNAGLVQYTYSGCEVNRDYIFRIAALYDSDKVESKVTNSVSISTHEAKPEAPTVNLKPETKTLTNDVEKIKVTVSWSEPVNTSFSYYNLYINGELINSGEENLVTGTTVEKEAIPSGTTEFVFEGTQGSAYFVKMSAVNGSTEGEMSQTEKVTLPLFDQTNYDAQYPAVVDGTAIRMEYQYETAEDEANKVIREKDNAVISWTGVNGSETNAEPSGYYVYLNGTAVKDPVNPDQNLLVTGTSYTATLSPGSEYAVQIQSVTQTETEEFAAKKSSAEYFTVPTPEYAAPGTVDAAKVTASYDRTGGALSLTIQEAEAGVDYYLIYSGGNLILDGENAKQFTGTAGEDGSVTLTLENVEAEKDYVYQIVAVKEYESGAVVKTSEKSDPIDVTTKEETDPPAEMPDPFTNKPVINRSITDGLSRGTIYWKNPEPGEQEKGGVAGYHLWVTTETDPANGSPVKFKKLTEKVTVDGEETERAVTIQPCGTGGENKYEFTEVSGSLYVYVEAFKLLGTEEVLGTDSNQWTISTACNIISKGDYDDEAKRDDPETEKTVTNPDPDGDGVAVLAGRTIKIRGKVNVAATVALYDEFDQVVASTNAEGEFELSADIGANTEAEVLALAESSGKDYTLKVTKPCSTSFTITNIDLLATDVSEIDVKDVLLYLGDANGDGIVNSTDLQLVNMNYGKDNGGEAVVGDANGDAKVNATDLQLVNMNYGKGSTSMTYEQFTAAQTN